MKMKGKWGSGPEGVDDLSFHTYGNFLFLLLLFLLRCPKTMCMWAEAVMNRVGYMAGQSRMVGQGQ